MIILASLLICIIGLLMWALASNPLVKDAGRIMFGCGLLVTLFHWPASSVSMFGGS
jgi:hypothetical protein